MSDRLSALCLALLLAAPLCVLLDSELFRGSEAAAGKRAVALLSRESVERHAEGLRHGTRTLAQNQTLPKSTSAGAAARFPVRR